MPRPKPPTALERLIQAFVSLPTTEQRTAALTVLQVLDQTLRPAATARPRPSPVSGPSAGPSAPTPAPSAAAGTAPKSRRARRSRRKQGQNLAPAAVPTETVVDADPGLVEDVGDDNVIPDTE